MVIWFYFFSSFDLIGTLIIQVKQHLLIELFGIYATI